MTYISFKARLTFCFIRVIIKWTCCCTILAQRAGKYQSTPKWLRCVRAGKNKWWELQHEVRLPLSGLRSAPAGCFALVSTATHFTSGREASVFPPPSLSKGSAKISISGRAPQLGHLFHLATWLESEGEVRGVHGGRNNMKTIRVLVLLLLASVHVFTPGEGNQRNSFWLTCCSRYNGIRAEGPLKSSALISREITLFQRRKELKNYISYYIKKIPLNQGLSLKLLRQTCFL